MQTTNETPLNTIDRHQLIKAGRDLVKLQIAHAAPAVGITSQNLYAWLKDINRTTLGEPKQIAAMEIFGLLPSGRLTEHALHAWQLSSSAASQVDVFLERETGISDVIIRPAFTEIRNKRDGSVTRKFLGASVEWRAPRTALKRGSADAKDGCRMVGCRLIVTTVDMELPALIQTLVSAFGARSKSKPKVLEALNVTPRAAEQVWRSSIRSRVTPPPNKGLLPIDQDIVGIDRPAAESPRVVLGDMSKRFKLLMDQLSAATNRPVAAKDQALLRRANEALSASEG
ncbi:hypothetical protein [Paracidovorax wautersii]|uniref:Uncharacterized protein n=1 Tax=Paracidovorax wautersii TaxID=1177982 RepID=A0A1I2HQU3_9BURK|nr:hypothetical protein [Paracidovorax wautersii]SFF31207.1 hypothetical protein SAMN04489711_12611 [Paracidovorax wautersii]